MASPVSVLFDMDGLLLDTEVIYRDTFLAAGRAHGMDDLHEAFLAVIGLQERESRATVERALAGRAAYEDFNATWDSNLVTAMAGPIDLRPGVRRLLDHLKTDGVAMAVATSTRTEKARERLASAGLLEFFGAVVGADQVANGKPQPDVYHAAAAQLGVEAPTCVAFEDSDPGTTAAFRSGARTVQVPDLKPPSPETVALGHIIAPSILEGAARVGLIT